MNKKVIYIITGFVLLAVFGAGIYFMHRGPSTNEWTGNRRPANTDSARLRAALQEQNPVSEHDMLSEFQSELRENPEDPALLGRIADKFFQRQRYSEALPYYVKVAKLKPEDFNNLNDLGLTYHYLGRTEEGVEHLGRAAELDPGNQRIWLTKGFLLMTGLKDLEGARVALEKSRSMDPESSIGKAAAKYLLQLN